MKIATLDAHNKQAKTRQSAALKWRVMSLLMRTVGRASDGIDTGYRHGFDSGIMLDKVYENRASGRYLIGPVIVRFYLNAVGWKAIRTRRVLLNKILHNEIEQVRAHAGQPAGAPAEPVVLLDVAAGPGRYLLELCLDMQAGGAGDLSEQLSVICRDLSVPALEQGRALAQS